MARPTTKAELLQAAANELERLLATVATVAEADREQPGACEGWSVKDLLAHLSAWHSLFLTWEAEGSAGGTPAMPAPGYTWTDTPALNAAIYEKTAGDSWAEVNSRLRTSHAQVITVIKRYDAVELFAKRRITWTGSTSLGSYAVSTTSSHYAWASKLIRAWARRHD